MTALDFQRMVLGDAPPLFAFEIVVRTVVIYAYTLVLLRWLGSRAIGQMSKVEFLLVIALGSAVGDAMFYPEVPLLHSLIVVTLVVLANKGLDILLSRNRHIEYALDGKPREAIRDGVICPAILDGSSLSHRELFQKLREHGVRHLGEVRHAYIETDGVLTVFKAEPPLDAGLPIVPPWEVHGPEVVELENAGTRLLACMRCGTITLGGEAVPSLPDCHHTKWVRVPASPAH